MFFVAKSKLSITERKRRGGGGGVLELHSIDKSPM